jgi:DNA-binding beta-propeller fold protein YncE
MFRLAIILAAALLPSTFAAKKDVGGLSVSLGVHPIAAGAELQEDVPVTVSIRIDDSKGNPMPGVNPAAWMSLRSARDRRSDSARCTEKIATFTVGNVFLRPEVDLNVFHVLALNDDATVSVIDPHLGFGGSRLLALAELRAPGEDWTLNGNTSRLFVSMPDAGAVAVIDTTSWKVLREIATGAQPRRVVLAPDGRTVWVADRTGAVALRPDGSGVAAAVPTPEPPREIVMIGRDSAAAVGGTTVTFIDTVTLHARGSVALPAAANSADFSVLSGRLYVATGDGHVTVIDPAKPRVVAQVDAGAAVAQVRFESRGRYGFLVLPSKNEVRILDTSSDRLIQTADVGKNPDRVSFSDNLAYVRSLGSDEVLMIPLDKIGTPGAPVPVVDFPAGQKRFDQGPAPSIADGIVAAPGDPAVIVGNPADREIYYYREGMAAPMGHFSNDGRAPRAVLILDRSLRRQANGEFRTNTRLGHEGTYDVAVFVDSPRIVTCFTMTVAPNPEIEARRRPHAVVQYAVQDLEGRAGQPLRIAFRIVDPSTSHLKSGLRDVTALLFAPGLINKRQAAVAHDDGTYEVDVVPPSAGVYYLSIESTSAGLPLNNPGILILHARG